MKTLIKLVWMLLTACNGIENIDCQSSNAGDVSRQCELMQCSWLGDTATPRTQYLCESTADDCGGSVGQDIFCAIQHALDSECSCEPVDNSGLPNLPQQEECDCQ